VIHRLPGRPGGLQVGTIDRDWEVCHAGLGVPAGEVVRGSQPLEAAPPPLAHGRTEGQAQPPGPEDKPQFLGRKLVLGGCRKTHVTSITRDVSSESGHNSSAQPVTVISLDHLVLTVADLDRAIGFYERVLGMRPVTFGVGRRALEFGASKINLHQAGQEIAPHAARPVPGSADLCLLTTTPPDQVLAHLSAQHVPVEDGPVPRTGARGPITSVYIRDPDGNLIEIASYLSDLATAPDS
jgi:catechol 2,3-dioxygenase-like lactoylglutathione lyase family enzyme